MVFTQQFRVRFDECASDGAARASVCLRYVVETAFAHSTHAGFPLAWYDNRGLHWLVRRVRLDLSHPVPYGALLSVTTEVVGFRRIWARRRNTIQNEHGHLLGHVALDWIFTDQRGTPTRVLPEMEAAFPTNAERSRLEVEHLEVGPVPPGVPLQEYRVPPHQTDPRGHMNSAAYLELFEDALAEAHVDPQTRPVTYELEYLRPLVPGELIHRCVWPALEGWTLLVTSAGAVVVRGRRS